MKNSCNYESHPDVIRIYEYYPDNTIVFYFMIDVIKPYTPDSFAYYTFFKLEFSISLRTLNSDLCKLLMTSFRNSKILCELFR